MSDPDITLWTTHAAVRQIIQARTDSHRLKLLSQDSSPEGGERIIQSCSAVSSN